MCDKGRCYYCKVIKKACLILAFINAIANACLLLFCCYIWYRLITYTPEEPDTGTAGKIGGIQWGRRYKHDNAIDDFVRPKLFFDTRWIFISILTLLSLLNIIFNFILCNGILYRRLLYVNVYLAYSVAMITPITIITLLQLSLKETPNLGIAGLCGFAFHLLFLVLVYQMRQRLRKELTFAEHVPLQMVEIDTRPSAPPLYVFDE